MTNNRALVALDKAGLGLVDSYLHTKLYLADSVKMPGEIPVLDVTEIPTVQMARAVILP